MTIEEGLKLVISGGILAPESLLGPNAQAAPAEPVKDKGPRRN